MSDETESGQQPEPEKKKKRRKHPRAKCDWKVRVVTPKKKQMMARAKNVSIGGIMIEIPEKFNIGENLYLEIQAIFRGKTKTMKVVGTVVYVVFQSGSFNLGLQFATDTKDFMDYLKDYVHKKTE